MSLATQIKPISHLKANTADVVKEVTETQMPLFITQNGEAKVVVQDIGSYEETQETLALLKIIALGENDYKNGQTKSLAQTQSDLHRYIDECSTK